MGVPKFYRWISERYPCLSQVVKDYQVSPTYWISPTSLLGSVRIYGTGNPVHLPNPNPYPTSALTNLNFRCHLFQLTPCSQLDASLLWLNLS